MVSRSFLLLWGDSSLEVELRLAVLEVFTSVVLPGVLLEVLFHEVNVLFVVLLFDSGIPPDQDTELMQGLRN